MAQDLDGSIRGAAIAFIQEVMARSGGRVTRAELESFTFDGRRLPLIEQRGIRKPAGLEAALTITTAAPRPNMPYDDHQGEDRYMRYKWRGTDSEHADNRALRRAMELGKPLAWFIGVAPGIYAPVVPVWLVGEEKEEHQFVVAIEEDMRDQWSADLFHPVDLVYRRRYAEAIVKQRLHQRVFRERVILAYESRCAVCRLRHAELLDAAHIKEDADGGQPIVPNGVSLCAIHHRAFDWNVVGIAPDYTVHVRRDVLEEEDGPTLQYALQGVHGTALVVPRQRDARPDPSLLEERFDRFLQAG